MSSPSEIRDVLWIARLLTERASLAPALLDGPAFASAVRGRMHQLAISDVAQYATKVEQSDYELQCLASEVAVPETWFFRYPASFDFLREHLTRRLQDSSSNLIAASLGCATGVEAWCIAACALSAGWPKDRVIVHAIDRSPLAIASARQGRIPGGSLRNALPDWAEAWIRTEGSSVVLSPEVRSCVQFREADLLTTPELFTQPVDALFCRNVMIYLDAAARVLLRDRIVNWVARDGLVFLGHADGLERGMVLEMAGPPAAFAWRPRAKTAPAEAPATPQPRVIRPSVLPPIVRTIAATLRPSAISRPTPVAPTPVSTTLSIAQRVQPMLAAREFDSAQRLIEAGLSASPTNIELIELLAGLFSAQNQLVRASQTYARLVYLDPNHGPALLALAELSNALGRTDDAKRYQARLKRLSDS